MLKFNRLAQLSKEEAVIADALAKSSSGLLEVSIIDDCRLVNIENLILINSCLFWKGNPQSSFMVKNPFAGSRRQEQNQTQSRKKDSRRGQQLEGRSSEQVTLACK